MKNTTNLLFVAMEEKIRKCLRSLKSGTHHKSTIIKMWWPVWKWNFTGSLPKQILTLVMKTPSYQTLDKIVELYLNSERLPIFQYPSRKTLSSLQAREQNQLKHFEEKFVIMISKFL